MYKATTSDRLCETILGFQPQTIESIRRLEVLLRHQVDIDILAEMYLTLAACDKELLKSNRTRIGCPRRLNML